MTLLPENGRGPLGPAGSPRIPAIALVLLAGLALRVALAYVFLPREGFGDDIHFFNTWAQVLADHGPGGFYANALGPGQAPGVLYPPGYLYILWVVGAAGHALAGLAGAAPADVIASLIKVPAIIADILIAALLYRVGLRWSGVRVGVLAAALYLFAPVTWYDSALWGQVDSVGALMLLAALVLLIDGWSEPAAAVAVLAAVTKPQYAIGLVVVGAVLLSRHLLRPASGPRPDLRGPLLALDRRLHGWFTERQGGARLVGSLVVAAVAFTVLVLPFDLPVMGPSRVAGIPVLGHVAGLVVLVRSAFGLYPYLTLNAFNGWALAGPTPLTGTMGRDDALTVDSLHVLGPISAAQLGSVLLAVVLLIVFAALLVRSDRTAILIGFTVLAVAFFVVPTRAHERYLFPALASGALLAAVSVGWRWWFVLLALANAANLHAILTYPVDGFGTPGLRSLPLGDTFRTGPAVSIVSISQVVLFLWVLVVFVRTLGPVFADRASASRRPIPPDDPWRRPESPPSAPTPPP